MSGKSTFGLSENIANLVCYLGGFITGIVFLVSEKENKSVRFNALQSTIWFGALCVLTSVLGVLSKIPVLGIIFMIVSLVVGLIIFVSWLFLMYNAYKGVEFRIPIIGDIVYGTVNK